VVVCALAAPAAAHLSRVSTEVMVLTHWPLNSALAATAQEQQQQKQQVQQAVISTSNVCRNGSSMVRLCCTLQSEGRSACHIGLISNMTQQPASSTESSAAASSSSSSSSGCAHAVRSPRACAALPPQERCQSCGAPGWGSCRAATSTPARNQQRIHSSSRSSIGQCTTA
jgi:hypothetical protein